MIFSKEEIFSRRINSSQDRLTSLQFFRLWISRLLKICFPRWPNLRSTSSMLLSFRWTEQISLPLVTGQNLGLNSKWVSNLKIWGRNWNNIYKAKYVWYGEKRLIKKVRNTTEHKSYQAPREFAKETIECVKPCCLRLLQLWFCWHKYVEEICFKSEWGKWAVACDTFVTTLVLKN